MAKKGKGQMRAEKTVAEKIADRVAERTRLGLTTATVERLLHAGEDGHEHTPSNVQRVTEAPLDRLHRQGFLTEAEFEAGHRYASDAYLAAVEPSPGSVDWNNAGGSRGPKAPTAFASQAVYEARQRVRAIEARMSGAIKVVANLALVHESPLSEIGSVVFGFRDRKEAMVAGRVATRMACAALVDLYRG
jgi:hypothetical protein